MVLKEGEPEMLLPVYTGTTAIKPSNIAVDFGRDYNPHSQS
jgi:hypothetical protein